MNTVSNLNDTRTFRPEIEGLRAVAATLVMVYHIFLGRVSGGVDVFFLVAGFLITGSLLRQVARTGTIRPGAFLLRLARRLLPNALVVLLVVIAATYIWVPITQQIATFREIIASTLYYENWALIAKATDYLAAEQIQSPVQHFWAMSIQGQFYIIWLVVFGIALLLSRGRKNVRFTLTILLVVLFAASLTFSVIFTQTDQPVAYFHTAARVWEFAAGGLFALAATKIPAIPEPVRVAASWIGLASIVFLGILIPVGNLFPGYIALIPIIGALLILLAGPSKSKWSATKLLSSRPMIYLGSISYGLYLWHWPILIFYKHHTGREIIGPRSGGAIILLSLTLAALTTHLIEKPIRTGVRSENAKRRAGRRRAENDETKPRLKALRSALLTLLPLGAVAITAAFSVTTVSIGKSEIDPSSIATDYPGAMSRAELGAVEPQTGLDPHPDLLYLAANKPEHYELGCHQDLISSEIIECDIGAHGDLPEGVPVITLVGGSHSAHWVKPVSEIAKTHGWHATAITKSSCLFSTELNEKGSANQSCIKWNDAVIEQFEKEAPDLVIMTATRGRGAEEHVPTGYLERWQQLDELGIEVLAIRDNPRSATNWVDCLAENAGNPEKCDIARDEVLSETDPTSALDPTPANVHFVDFSDIFCDEKVCNGIIGNIVVYRDAHHISDEFALSFAPLLEKEIIEAMNKILVK